MSLTTLRKSALFAAAAATLAAGGIFAGRLFAGSMPGEGERAPRHMFGRMARALELTDDQKAQVRSILKSHAAEIEQRMAAGAAARRALRDAIRTEPVNESAIRAAAAAAGSARADGAVLFARIRAEVLPVLTADQRQKLQAMEEKMKSRGERGAKALSEFVRSGS